MLLRKQQLGRIRLWLRVLLRLQLRRLQLWLQQQLRLHPRSLLLSYFFCKKSNQKNFSAL